MKTLAERAQYARNRLGLTQGQVAKLTGLTQQGYQDIESGKSKRPRNIEKIAYALQVPVEWLQFGQGNHNPIENIDNVINPQRLIPILSWNDIKPDLDWPAIIEEKPNKEFIPMFGNGSAHSFALRIQGDSMVSSIPGEHTFIENEIILVDPEKTPKHGDFVVVLQKGGTQAIFKQYLIEGTNIYLSSLNPRYPTIPFNETIQICGVVIAKQKNFD